MPPSAFAASGRGVELDAPNGIHFHPPADFRLAGAPRRVAASGACATGSSAITSRTPGRCSRRPPPWRPRRSSGGCAPASSPSLVRGGGGERRPHGERLVHTLEIWVAAIAGQPAPPPGRVDRLARFDRAARAFSGLVRAIGDRDGWEDAFVDALCEPPQSFTYEGVVAHVIEYGAVRRHALAGIVRELGGAGAGAGGGADSGGGADAEDPVMWELGSTRAPPGRRPAPSPSALRARPASGGRTMSSRSPRRDHPAPRPGC